MKLRMIIPFLAILLLSCGGEDESPKGTNGQIWQTPNGAGSYKWEDCKCYSTSNNSTSSGWTTGSQWSVVEDKFCESTYSNPCD